MFLLSFEDGANPPRTLPSVLHWNANEPVVQAIGKRARSLLAQRSGGRLEDTAEELGLPVENLRQFLCGREPAIDTIFLIDVVAALVHDSGVDPKWLLTGQYDGALHRLTLLLGEDRSPKGVRAIRRLVEAEYRQLRRPSLLSSVPSRVSAFFKP